MRLIPRILLFVITAFAAGYLLAWVLLLVGVVAFGESTPECTDSDTCGAWGDFFYNTAGQVLCLMVGAAIAWRVVPIRSGAGAPRHSEKSRSLSRHAAAFAILAILIGVGGEAASEEFDWTEVAIRAAVIFAALVLLELGRRSLDRRRMVSGRGPGLE